MTRVFKEHEIKTKMEQEQWLHLRMLFLLGYNLKIIIWWGGGGGRGGVGRGKGLTFCWGGGNWRWSQLGGIFIGGG